MRFSKAFAIISIAAVTAAALARIDDLVYGNIVL
jgi:hypothetical protein